MQQTGKLFTGTAACRMIGAPGIGIPRPSPGLQYNVFIQNHSRGSRCLIKGSELLYRKVWVHLQWIRFGHESWPPNFYEFDQVTKESKEEGGEVYTMCFTMIHLWLTFMNLIRLLKNQKKKIIWLLCTAWFIVIQSRPTVNFIRSLKNQEKKERYIMHDVQWLAHGL